MARTNTNVNTGITAITNDSIQGDGTLLNPIQLVNDVAIPGTSKYYGTNPAGTRGFFSISALVLPSLALANIWIGDALNTAVPYPLTGAITVDNVGATKLLSFSSAELYTALTDETGIGLAVFNSNPTFRDNINIGTLAVVTGAESFIGKTSGKVVLSVEDAAGTYTMKLPSALGGAGTFLKQTNAGGSTAFTSITVADITSGQAVTKTDDTNVTMTLSAGAGSAALAAYTMALGWTGLLSAARGGNATPTTRGHFSTVFETATRFSISSAAATVVFGTGGVQIDTSLVTSFAQLQMSTGNNNFSSFNRSPAFYTEFQIKTLGSAGEIYAGIGNVAVTAAGHTFTNAHIGFKILIVAGVASLYATQAGAVGETASAVLTTIGASDCIEVYAVVNGSSSVDYYWSKNGGALSSATNLANNVPTGTADSVVFQGSISNAAVLTSTQITFSAASYSR